MNKPQVEKAIAQATARMERLEDADEPNNDLIDALGAVIDALEELLEVINAN